MYYVFATKMDDFLSFFSFHFSTLASWVGKIDIKTKKPKQTMNKKENYWMLLP